jgi:hypothetical protein
MSSRGCRPTRSRRSSAAAPPPFPGRCAAMASRRGWDGRPWSCRASSYGRLTVLGELPERSRGGRVFRCLCACGRETDARAVELRQGKIRSCGCLRDETRLGGHTRPPPVQSGQRYGRLVVLHEPGRESPTGARVFSCGCDCGGTTTVRGANLTSAHTRSCGCLLEEYRQRGTRTVASG